MLKLSAFILIFYAISNCDCKSIKPLSDKGREIWFNETIPSNKFGASGFGGSWISGTEFTYTDSRELIKLDVVTNEKTTLYDKAFAERWTSSSLQRSPDGSKVLIRYEPRAIFRHSTVAKFSVVFANDDQKIEYKISNGDELQLCKFSPNGQYLIFIKDNTIRSLTDANIRANSSGILRSPIGEPGVIYYGIPDWVYEEEVLGSDAAAWFSSNGKYMAFASFDDRNVTEFTYEIYGNGKGQYQYPEEVKLRYPKVGDNNPKVSLVMEDLSQFDMQNLPLVTPDEVGLDHILGTVFWISNLKAGAIWLNRRQNYSIIVSYTYVNDFEWRMETIAEIREPNGWIELDTPKCEVDGICYFINNANNWPSLTKIDTNSNTLTALTSNKHVFSYLGSRDGKIYYSATPGPNESFNRHTYVLDNGVEKCLTCELVTPEGNKCTYATTSFSTDLSYYALTCSGPDVSFTNIYNTDSSTKILEWRTNQALRTTLEDYELPKIKIFHVTVGDTVKFQAPVKMQVPPEIDLDNLDKVTEKYPLLVRVYGGPGSVRISSTFSIGYNSYQVTSKKIIYVEIDGRGTGQKGVDMMFSVNDRLGTYEMEDQISVTKYLIKNYKFIDKERVSIWGWSYGGYATAMTLAKDTEKVFKCGVSVAPVTSWIFYDTIYTERYMGIDPYSAHYNNSDVSTPEHIKVIGQHDFLLVHGNADDNVHYQQSMVLAGALERADILFDQMSYPDEAHSLSGVSLHLYHSLDRFWDKCFKL